MGKKSVLLAAALAVAGLCILLWPVVSGHRLQADMSAAAQGFLEEARQPYSEVLTDLQEYNERIYAERQAGDTVTITNLWETLTYAVVDVKIIQPDQVDKIKIQPGRDLLTLITCHPYASGGRQRLVVYCERRK